MAPSTGSRSYAAAIVLVPGAPLIGILIGSQVLNAVLLPPLLWFMRGSPPTGGSWASMRSARTTTLLVTGCVALWAALIIA